MGTMPTLSCGAGGPMTIHPDETSTLTLNGRSPQNLPLTYKCTSSAGKIDLVGNRATFSPEGSAESQVTINCTVNDDKSKTADCNARLTIVSRPQPPVPNMLQLCSIDFSKDEKRPTRVDNEAKACLDQVALALQQHPDDTLFVVGEAANTELGAQRAVNTKNYLTTEKGIDASRITVATGDEGTQGVEEYLEPSGASAVRGTHPVDENAVKPQERKPLPMPRPAPRPPAAPEANHPLAKPSPTQGSSGP
jgi:outer membrane protein OmpA-like peptidoglycan-associated protein